MSVENGQPVGNFGFIDTLSVAVASDLAALDTTTFADGQQVLVNERNDANGGWWAFSVSTTGEFNSDNLVYASNGYGAFYRLENQPLGVTINPDGTIQAWN